MKHQNLIKELAEKVRDAGGRLMLVGGTVRDEFLGKQNKDCDCEVYGLEPERLREVLETFGKVDAVGASFAVYKLGQDIDVSLPRREKKVGVGHKGFEVTGDPFMSFKEACSRRDFSINAMMKDPLTGELVDPFSGQIHLQMGILHAVSDKTFQEDSLRVLRLAQFASRFDFNIAQKTWKMAVETDLSDLPKERVWMEIEKLLMKSSNPAVGVEFLVDLGIAEKLFPAVNLERMAESPVLEALRQAPHFCNDLSYGEKLSVLATLFCYCSDIEGLDQLGLNSVEGYNVRKKVEAMLEHLPYKAMDTDYDFHKLSQKAPMKLMSRVIFSFSTAREFAERFAKTIERLGIEEAPMKPVVTGKYLMQYGMKPSKQMGEALAELYDLQMQGVVDAALWELARNKCGVSDCSDERQPTEYPLIGE